MDGSDADPVYSDYQCSIICAFPQAGSLFQGRGNDPESVKRTGIWISPLQGIRTTSAGNPKNQAWYKKWIVGHLWLSWKWRSGRRKKGDWDTSSADDCGRTENFYCKCSCKWNPESEVTENGNGSDRIWV